MGYIIDIPSGKQTQLLKMAIEIVDLSTKNGDFPQLCGCLPEGILMESNGFFNGDLMGS